MHLLEFCNVTSNCQADLLERDDVSMIRLNYLPWSEILARTISCATFEILVMKLQRWMHYNLRIYSKQNRLLLLTRFLNYLLGLKIVIVWTISCDPLECAPDVQTISFVLIKNAYRDHILQIEKGSINGQAHGIQ